MWPNGSLLDFQVRRTVADRIMAEPPVILLLVAADERDRLHVGGLLRDGTAEVHWATGIASALAAVAEHPHDAVLMDAARVCSLQQVTEAFFEVGGQYRRNV